MITIRRTFKCVWLRVSRKVRKAYEYYFVTCCWRPEKMYLNDKGNWAFAPGFWANRGVVHTEPEFFFAAEWWKEQWRQYFRQQNLQFIEPTVETLPPDLRARYDVYGTPESPMQPVIA